MLQIHEVIIIGAGISGIGASRVLTSSGVPHLILESRDRYGGRIYPDTFAGITVDIGATFIHNPDSRNKIYEFIKDNGFRTVEASNEDEYYYQGNGMLEEDEERQKRVEEIYEEAYKFIDMRANEEENDISIEEAVQDFVDEEMDGEEPEIRDIVLWKLRIEGNIEGAELNELSAQKQSIEQKKQDLLPLDGGFPMVFQNLYRTCKPHIRFNTRVLSIDYSGQNVRIHTTNGQYFAKKVISSLPLGILQAGRVQFIPGLPHSYQNAINSIGNGNENKLFCLFRKPFWQAKEGWINFVTKKKDNRYPIGFIYPNSAGKHILLIFVAGKISHQIGSWQQFQVIQDVKNFLQRFIDPSQIQLQDVKLSRWHADEHSLGSYCFNKVGTKQSHFDQLRKPIQNKFWFVGQHTHPKLSSYAHGAYQTGLWAADEVIRQLKGIQPIEQQSNQEL